MEPTVLVGWGLLAGAAGVTLVNILKTWFDLEGKQAQLLTYAVSLVLGAAVLALNGELLPFSVDRLVVIGPAIFITADALYRFIVKDQS